MREPTVGTRHSVPTDSENSSDDLCCDSCSCSPHFLSSQHPSPITHPSSAVDVICDNSHDIPSSSESEQHSYNANSDTTTQNDINPGLTMTAIPSTFEPSITLDRKNMVLALSLIHI